MSTAISANPSSYNAVGSTEMARPKGRRARLKGPIDVGLLGEGMFPSQPGMIWRIVV